MVIYIMKKLVHVNMNTTMTIVAVNMSIIMNTERNADAAMTGANFAVASTGDVVVCTNEGNADMGMGCQHNGLQVSRST